MFLNNSDGLPWNSIPGIGAYYPIILLFLVIGILVSLHRRNLIDKLLILGCISTILIILVVTPNYNHWIFIHFIVLSFIIVGINEISINRKIQIAIILSYGILFLNFSSIYFKQRNIAVGQYDVNLIKTIKNSLVLIDVKKDTGFLVENKKLKKIGQNKINSETYNVYVTVDKN